MPADLVVVHHSRGGQTALLTEEVVAGAREAAGSLTVEAFDAFAAGSDDVLAARAVVIGTPARFGYMSGAVKDFLERIYYPCLERTGGMPFALYVKGDSDTAGAVASVERIVAGLKWRRVLPVLEVVGTIGSADLIAARELGAAMAAGLDAGIFSGGPRS